MMQHPTQEQMATCRSCEAPSKGPSFHRSTRYAYLGVRYLRPPPPLILRSQPSSSNNAGGKAGRCPPPSPRLAGCLRELRRATREAGLESSFDVTLEVTHHGPWLETPASEFLSSFFRALLLRTASCLFVQNRRSHFVFCWRVASVPVIPLVWVRVLRPFFCRAPSTMPKDVERVTRTSFAIIFNAFFFFCLR